MSVLLNKNGPWAQELNFNALGAFYATGATVLRAVKSLIQGRLLSPSHTLDSVLGRICWVVPLSVFCVFRCGLIYLLDAQKRWGGDDSDHL